MPQPARLQSTCSSPFGPARSGRARLATTAKTLGIALQRNLAAGDRSIDRKRGSRRRPHRSARCRSETPCRGRSHQSDARAVQGRRRLNGVSVGSTALRLLLGERARSRSSKAPRRASDARKSGPNLIGWRRCQAAREHARRAQLAIEIGEGFRAKRLPPALGFAWARQAQVQDRSGGGFARAHGASRRGRGRWSGGPSLQPPGAPG